VAWGDSALDIGAHQGALAGRQHLRVSCDPALDGTHSRVGLGTSARAYVVGWYFRAKQDPMPPPKSLDTGT